MLGYCIPTYVNGSATVKISLNGDFQQPGIVASQAMADLYTAWPLLLAGAFAALLFSFAYMWVAKDAANCIVWSCILLMAGMGFLVGFVFYYFGKQALDSQITQRGYAMFGIGIAVWICTFIYLCLCVYLRGQIE